MTVVLGPKRRKTRPADDDAPADRSEDSDSNGDAAGDLQAVFRRHFEAQFQPLAPGRPEATKRRRRQADDDDDDDIDLDSSAEEDEQEDGSDGERERGAEGSEDDWEGFSGGSASEEEEDDDVGTARPHVVEVVDHAAPRRGDRPALDKAAKRAFMSSKPPSAHAPKPQTPSTRRRTAKDDDSDSDDGDDDDATNAANDLALQRLLRESHLLDGAQGAHAGGSLAPTGRARIQAQDLAFQALGSKTSVLAQRNMPMAQRKGIAAAQREREAKRRREARENGIVLEVERREKKKKDRKRERERGVGAPAVGKFKGGTLQLSREDVRQIQGPPPRRGEKRGRR